jgi:murein L,D-transpeptidase YafK
MIPTRRSCLLGLIFFAVAMAVGCASASSASRQSAPLATRPVGGAESESTTSQANNKPLNLPLIKPRITVWKAQRRLELFAGDKLVRTYRIGLGLSPAGDKVREGDRRTPEGDFYIFVKNAKSAFYLSLGVSYPNLAHAKRGLRDGLVTQAQYDRIVAALNEKKGPPQNTPLGGLIYIHGNGSRTDWTWGCVALENEDVKELYNAVEIGTPIRINP